MMNPAGRISVAVVCGLVVFLLVSSSARAWYPYSDRYNEWQKGRPFTYGAWHNSKPTDHLPDRVARFRAAGLNNFFWVKPGRAEHFFKACAAQGLEWQCGMRIGKREQLSRMIREIPGCAAIIVVDEPATVDKTEQEQRAVYDDLRERIDWVHKSHPGILAYSNLSIRAIDHDRYVTTCRPDVFSFDHYPLMLDDTTEEHYYENVLRGRTTATKYHLPYWIILQAFGREVYPRPSHANRMPYGADVRFLVYMFLAHGGTGLHFWTYYAAGNCVMVTDRGIAHDATPPPAEHHYERTAISPMWFGVRDVASEVQVLGRALRNLRTKDPLGYVGWVPKKCPAFESYGALKAVRNMKDAKEPVLVGFFDDREGQEYFMVVNLVHGLRMSKAVGSRTVRLTFDPSVTQIERLNRLTGRVETLTTREKAGVRILDVQLEGGTGDLFKWSNGKPWALSGK